MDLTAECAHLRNSDLPRLACKPALCNVLRIGGGAMCCSLRAISPMGGTQQTSGWHRMVRPMFGLALLGITATRFPQLLWNGRDVSQLLFAGAVPFVLAVLLLVLKPAAILLCIGSGQSFAHIRRFARFGSGLSVVVRLPTRSSRIMRIHWRRSSAVGSNAGPHLKRRSHDGTDWPRASFLLPLLLAATIATMISRSIEPRSISMDYVVRLTFFA